MGLDNSDTDMYADDSSVTTSARTAPEIEQHLAKDADKVSKLCSDNRMAATTTKTKVMLITTWQKRASLLEHQGTLNVRMHRQYLEKVSSNKLLGITINHNLVWEEHANHVNSIVKKINSKLALLRDLKGCLPVQSHKMFSNAHIFPHMDYCFTVWCP